MNTRLFLLTLLNGVTLSGLLFIVSSGLALSFGLMRIVNLNHGAFYLTGAYIGLTVQRIFTHGYPSISVFALAVLSGGAGIAVLAFVEERFLLRLKRVRENKLVETLLTLAVAIIFADVDLVIWGGNPVSMRLPREFLGPMSFLGSMYSRYRIIVLAIAIIIAVTLWAILKKTQIGIMIRAGIDDSGMVAALGINIKRLFTLVFVLSGFLAGSAGVIGGGFAMLGPGEDWRMLQFALVIVIIGGMGSFGGMIVGALFTGLIFSFASIYLPSFSLFFIFLPVALLLAARPQGLFGREQ